jgi:hypothetical protein
MLMLILPVVAQAGGSQDSRDFNPLIGVWHVEKDGQRQVYAVDGRRWVQGKFSAVARDNAVELYGGKGPDFLRNIAGYKSFPLSIYREVKNFDSGTLSVSFKTIGGKEDEAAGIAFNIRETGEYLAVRANALENNLILFVFANGRRSALLEIENVPTAPQQWHALKVVIQGRRIEGYLDDKKYLDTTLKENVRGRIGLWSKADSHVAFDSFVVHSK